MVQRVGEPFMLGDVQLTVLSVQDPFLPTAQMQPAAGHRLVSIKYEVLSQSSTSQNFSALPAVELHDSTGARYQSEHGRVSVINGSPAPGKPATGPRMENNTFFDIPAPATGLEVTFRLPANAETAVVTLG